MACQCISPEVTVKGFKKCSISNAVDENDNNMLCNDSEDVIYSSERLLV